MRDLHCGSPHPDDYGPIRRYCCLRPRHPGPHRWYGSAAVKAQGIDEWENAG